MRWILPAPADPELCRSIRDGLGVPRFVAELLCRRGHTCVADIAQHLEPRLKALSDPFLLPAMDAAVDRLLVALDRGERIVLYGDYDVDGVTSLALLARVLRAFGSEAQCFLPLRIEEGYGLTTDGVTRCLETLQPQLLIAVDCGTSSATEIARLRAAGVDVLVFDHHECKSELPDCTALVNPKLGSDFQYLCSVGIVFKVAHALLKRRPLPGFDLRQYLDLVAVGTVADLVPLVGENRILVKHGLARLAQTQCIGLEALMEVAAIRPPLSPVDIGFKIGPRMNAAGRLGTAQDALELLLTEDRDRAEMLAQALDLQNRERREVEAAVLAAAELQLGECFEPERDAAIVVGAEGWHPGVVGIVASRLMRKHHRPTLVIGFDEGGIGKGSGRSIAGLSLVQALTECAPHLVTFGGHEMAAGLTVQKDRFGEFRDAFRACARRLLTDEQLQPRLHLDAELTLDEIGFPLLEQYEALHPFGMGNPQPTFFARRVQLTAEPRVMKEKHLSLQLRQGRGEARAVWFNGAGHDLPSGLWDIAFELDRNEYQGKVRAQIQIRAVRAAC